jgi:hypothetical protein
MYAHELFEAPKRIVVTYPGRFQPFHQGHAAVFAQLQKKWGRDNVYVLTSNDSGGPKSPFNFSDKYQLMTAAGVPGDRIVETNKMYSLPSEFESIQDQVIFIAAVGAPDAKRLNPDSYVKKDNPKTGKKAGDLGYFMTWGSPEKSETAERHGYVSIAPEEHKSITINGKTHDVSHGTDCRNLWNIIRNDETAVKQFLTQLYGKATPELVEIFNKIPEMNEDISDNGDVSTSPIHGGQIYEAGVGVVASKKQAKDPRYVMSLTKDVHPGAVQKSLRAFNLAEEENSDPQFPALLKDFFPIAMKVLGINTLPKIELEKHLAANNGQATFGRFVNGEDTIYLALNNRHPIDILRTLAHELTHYKQFKNNELDHTSGETGSPEENEAHVEAGIIMRYFDKKYPDSLNLKPIILP